MRGRSVFRAGLLLAVAASALLLQASCATRGGAGGDGSGRGTGAGEVPERYADWTVVYSTGDNEVFSARLDGSGPRRLFAAGGEIDWSLLLRPVGELSEVLYERIRDGRLELMSFSAETGEVTSLACDIGDVVAVTDGRAYYIASGDGDEDALWERDLRSGEARPVPTKGAVSGLGSAEASGPPLFSVARSDPRVDPVDQDLYIIEGGRPVKIASAPARHGFGPAFSLPAGVLFVVSEQGGEEHGSVRFWSRTTGETAELARHARILDASEHGGILLEEPLAGNGVRTSEGARAEGSRIVWFDSP
ncbi:MAG: hypothetical protein IBX62_04700, partial [Coriobacteriia bacterium]|nr:hypothetical protein [Coriobacteriia bacterium]